VLRGGIRVEPTVHILVTTDTLTSVWGYTRELVTSLVTHGHRVTLVSMGEIPLPEQTAWIEGLYGLDYRPTAFRLEWMQEGEEDLADSTEYLRSVIDDVEPDILHLGQFCYGSLETSVPRVVVAQGDLITWSQIVHDKDPKESRWSGWYRDVVTRGLAGASTVVAPTGWMLETLRETYGEPSRGCVIYNGRNPIFFNPYVNKEESVLAVGRLWDAGKQLYLLTQHKHPLPVCIVGADQPLHQPRIPIRADVKVDVGDGSVALKGPQTENQLRLLYSRAAMYAATARYEPFGMPALEAAFSRCAIVANDIPSLREIWGDDAVYFRTNDGASLAEAIRALKDDRELCRTYANRVYQRARNRFTAKRMMDDYVRLYRTLLAAKAEAA
jgi:glycosyltransferase involved in cell wall biosynthesis